MSESEVEEQDYYSNSLEIAGDNYKQSEVVKAHKHLPIDTKTSFLDKYEKIGYGYKSNAYDTLRYLKKLLSISRLEVDKNKNLKRDIYKCKNTTDLADYFKKINKNYLWYHIKYLPKSEKEEIVSQFIQQLDEARLSGLVEDIYNTHTHFKDTYTEYFKDNKQEGYIDDIGLLNNMMTTTEVSKAFKGQGIKSMNTTININKDVSPEEDAEEEPEESESAGRNFLGFKKKK